MNFPRVPIGLAVILLASLAAPATAQYMYLDTNGDGVHTAADQVNPSGPTVIDVWLDTDSNRDGSDAICSSNEPLTFTLYVFGLRATGGTISWGSFTNRQPGMAVHFGRRESDTEYMDGYGGFATLPPGTYHLGTLLMNVASGSPSIQIVPTVTVHPAEMTGFGSSCDGLNFDSVLRLGLDWVDADGLPFGTDGSPNTAPNLAQPADMSVGIGETASQILTATDPDHQPLAFTKVSGPSYATVTTIEIGQGTATGKVFLAPLVGAAGTATVVVGASDGTSTDQKPLSVAVHSTSNHTPTIEFQGPIEVVAGTTPKIRLTSIDPDGQPLAFTKIDGPDFAQVITLSSGPGAGAGSLGLDPTLCDAGASVLTVGVADGVSNQRTNLNFLVRVPSPATASPAPYAVPPSTNAVAIADLNSDGLLDVVAVGGGFTATLSVLMGRGDGTLAAAANQPVPVGDPSSVAIGDLNRDGKPDLAISLRLSHTVIVLLGRGDGTFAQGSTLPNFSYPTKLQLVDLNGDEILDLAAANGSGATVSIFQGLGDGTFGSRMEVAPGTGPYDVCVGDFNSDGRPDLATANFNSDPATRTVGILLGLGDGGFADRREVPFGRGTPFRIVTGDFNWDGKADLAVSEFGGGRVAIWIGDGAGGFTPTFDIPGSSEVPGFSEPEALATGDFNADGNLDLLIGDVDGTNPFVDIVYGAGDGTFGARRNLRQYPGASAAIGDLNRDGFPDAVLGGGGDQLVVWLNDAGGIGAAEARAFTEHGDKTLKPRAGGRTCFSLEPVAGSYVNTELDLGSLTLRSEGTGSVSQISAIPPKIAEEKDTDRNGIRELPACFESADLATLFDQVRGKQPVTAHLEGVLLDGRPFCARLDLVVDGKHNALAATVTPNPFNPQATLRYSTSGDGFVRVRIFDLNGRLVRTVLNQPVVAAGDHEAIIDGRGQNGEMLASGIYFYQVEALEGTVQGRITILK